MRDFPLTYGIQESLCGPATLIQMIARNDPENYVKYVWELFTTGQSSPSCEPGKDLNVDVSTDTYKKLRDSKPSIPDADYIALASLRALKIPWKRRIL